MSLRSSFVDFSIVECFRLVEQGRKTGRLTVSYLRPYPLERGKQYFWFQDGQFVATANTLDGTCLSSEVVRRNWLSQRVLEKLLHLSQDGRPLGLNLKLMGALQSEQVAALLGFQLKQLVPILEISDGEFQLESQASLPFAEMTGLSMGAMEVAVGALRQVRSWKALEDILPKSSSAIKQWKAGENAIRLTEIEQRIFEQADGRKSLTKIAQLLGYELELTRHGAFRLMMANLVDEVPPLAVHLIDSGNGMSSAGAQAKVTITPTHLASFAPSSVSPRPLAPVPISKSDIETKDTSSQKPSHSFLQGIVDFLRSKV